MKNRFFQVIYKNFALLQKTMFFKIRKKESKCTENVKVVVFFK